MSSDHDRVGDDPCFPLSIFAVAAATVSVALRSSLPSLLLLRSSVVSAVFVLLSSLRLRVHFVSFRPAPFHLVFISFHFVLCSLTVASSPFVDSVSLQLTRPLDTPLFSPFVSLFLSASFRLSFPFSVSRFIPRFPSRFPFRVTLPSLLFSPFVSSQRPRVSILRFSLSPFMHPIWLYPGANQERVTRVEGRGARWRLGASRAGWRCGRWIRRRARARVAPNAERLKA